MEPVEQKTIPLAEIKRDLDRAPESVLKCFAELYNASVIFKDRFARVKMYEAQLKTAQYSLRTANVELDRLSDRLTEVLGVGRAAEVGELISGLVGQIEKDGKDGT
jgi:hypothetical protein